VIGVLDGLRFGDPAGPSGRRATEIARGVVTGIWHYGNAIGVPNLGGDVVFHPSFDENCLVNVVALGLVRADRVVPSAVPRAAESEDYALILLGKPTDWSGMGGATLASRVLDAEKSEGDRGAVQAADPFLKRVLFEANREVFARLQEGGVPFGMKDLGAGGIGGMAAEIAAKGGFGMEVDLDRVHRVDADLPHEAIACAETQERFGLVVPARLAGEVLAIYNEAFALPHVHRGARASVVGRVLREPIFRLVARGEEVARLPIEALVAGVRVERAARPRPRAAGEDAAAWRAATEAAAPGARAGRGGGREAADPAGALRAILGAPAGASRALVYRYYDTEVQGRAVMRPGEADAGVLRPIPEAPFAVAVSLDGNPRLGAIDPRGAARHAVCEGVRNVVAAGGTPIGLTDCLNFGSPEEPEVFWDFAETIDGLSEAARALGLRDHPGSALPFVSGNVSFYNQSVSGRAIAPSPIVATFGVVEDLSLATTCALKEPGSVLVLLGPRGRELGGSLFGEHAGRGDGAIPPVDLAGEAARARAVEDAIRARAVLAAHDVSEGGLLVAVVEMALAAPESRRIGALLERGAFPRALDDEAVLWNEAGGYVLEVARRDVDRVVAIARARGVDAVAIGETLAAPALSLRSFGAGASAIDLEDLRAAWSNGLATVFAGYEESR
jgi:phosphoribosylformylglycinamidine synthase